MADIVLHLQAVVLCQCEQLQALIDAIHTELVSNRNQQVSIVCSNAENNGNKRK